VIERKIFVSFAFLDLNAQVQGVEVLAPTP
jgi:hypothetical protein